MPKYAIKFGAKLQQEFPFLSTVPGSQSDVVCSVCNGKFSVASGGRPKIGQHLNTDKHIRATRAANSNNSMSLMQKLEESSERKPDIENPSAGWNTSGSTAMDEQADFQVDDQRQNCRFCFEPFSDNRKSVEITETIEQQFLDLTQCQLIHDEGFSKVICITCDTELGVSLNFRQKLLENQRKLYEAQLQRNAVDIKEEFQSIIIKTEIPDEYIPEEVSMDSPAYDFEEEPPKKVVRGPYKKTKKAPELDDGDQQWLYNEIKILQRGKAARVKCPQCYKPMHNKSLREHFLTVHARQSRFKCIICSRDFYRRKTLTDHLEKVHGTKQKDVGKAKKLVLETVNERDPEIEGEENKKLFEEIKDLLKTTKEIRVKCPQCSKTLHKNSLKDHFFVVHAKQSRFKCDLCDKEFYRRNRLLQHFETKHFINQREVKVEPNSAAIPKTPCELCGAMTNDQRRHRLKVHLRVRNFFCDICPYGAFHKYDLEKHMQRHTKRNPDKYFCEVCGQQFEKRGYLTAHIRKRHTVREKTHQCTVCQKFFLTASILERHSEYHSARDLPCEFCGKLFTCKNNLRSHLYYHAPPKFICDFPNCDKKFYMKKLLRGHIKAHRGEKDFVCEFCDRCYYSQSDLNRHTFSIHKKLRFFCSLPGCNGDFSRRGYYKKHVLAVHQNLAADDMERLLEDVKVAIPSQK